MTAIILVEPAGALNLGSVARVMKNFGLTDLRLVAPLCAVDDPEALLMAVHAPEILATARIYADLKAAVADCAQVVGTTGRIHPLPALAPEATLPWLLASSAGALVFGPEDRGLSNEELGYCQQWLTLPTDRAYPSLNLAQAVGICCYLLRQSQPLVSMPITEPATSQKLEAFYDHWSETLLNIGYLLPHTQTRKMEKFRRIFSRAQLTDEEVTLLRGVLRQLRWSYQQEHDASVERGED